MSTTRLWGWFALLSLITVAGCFDLSPPPNGDVGPTEQTGVARGRSTFTTPRPAVGGQVVACAGCHMQDGAGDIGPDIRESTVDHLIEHAQGDGPHPEGVKFTSFTPSDFDEMAAYLESICRMDPICVPGSADEHDHEEGEDEVEVEVEVDE